MDFFLTVYNNINGIKKVNLEAKKLVGSTNTSYLNISAYAGIKKSGKIKNN